MLLLFIVESILELRIFFTIVCTPNFCVGDIFLVVVVVVVVVVVLIGGIGKSGNLHLDLSVLYSNKTRSNNLLPYLCAVRST